jgi:N-acetylglucosaminyldiphosphoundecaprenol N-acetyl-beta-D-mannosaminyltransferase
MSTPPERVHILGCPFDAVTFEEAVAQISAALENRERLHVGVGNMDMVMKTREIPEFADIFNACGLIICDGVPVTWAGKALGTPLKGRVSGTDMVWECAAVSERIGITVALIGAQFDTTQRAAEAMAARYPKAQLHAFPTPYPLTDEENDKLLATIRESGADMVLVALGAPKQERWIRDHLEASGACVGIGIGSAFDIISGDLPRAPRWMRDNGLEWLHRTFQDPRRLLRRYLVDDAPFIWHVFVAVVRRRLGGNTR